jgi:integrative and conjugative element protein (TIGR02256 family)
MLVEGRRALPNETGGVLLGYWSSSPDAAVVTRVSGPGPAANHRPRSFCPDTAFHAAEIARTFSASGGVQTYLGDWHTHPTGGSYLSQQDTVTLRTIAESAEACLPYPLMCVVGLSDRRADVSVWQYVRRRLRGAKLAALRIMRYEQLES